MNGSPPGRICVITTSSCPPTTNPRARPRPGGICAQRVAGSGVAHGPMGTHARKGTRRSGGPAQGRYGQGRLGSNEARCPAPAQRGRAGPNRRAARLLRTAGASACRQVTHLSGGRGDLESVEMQVGHWRPVAGDDVGDCDAELVPLRRGWRVGWGGNA